MAEGDPTTGLATEDRPAEETDEAAPESLEALRQLAENGAGPQEATAEAGAAVAAPPIEEPSSTGDVDTALLEAMGALPITPIPFPIPRRPVAGRYRSSGTPFQAELRVDVDGAHPTMRVSADYYSISGSTVTYFGSMRVDAVSVSKTPTTVKITGLGTYTWTAGFPRVEITIPRMPVFGPHGAATLLHRSLTGAPGATYICNFASQQFRTVQLEQDRQDTVPAPFVSYNTGSLPSGGPARTLSIAAAYAEAGVQMISSGATDVVNTSEAGANGTWSDAELHAAMVRHFSLWRDLPQWAVWLFHAKLHDLGPSLLGIMFDQQGRQRQGAAVFYEGLGGTTADKQRLQLYACVHELGHAFNLLHSWQKSLATPPVTPDRPGALSYMNYPQRFTGGAAAFWSAFPFQFDGPELIHIRHAFRDAVIMGGNAFGIGAALREVDGWRDPVEDRSGLELRVGAPKSFPYGVPVAVDLTLRTTDTRGKVVNRHLRPRNGTVEIAIQKPSGAIVLYRPLLHGCVAENDTIVLGPDRTEIRESAFIHYGRDGFVFDEPGFYEVRARHVALDGSIVLSNVAKIRVRPPLSKEDDEAAELIFGDEQGTLLYLVGSDFEGLKRGNDALDELIERYPDHPTAAAARIAKGANAAREFKHVGADNSVSVRSPEPEIADAMLSPVINPEPVRAAAKEAAPDERTRVAATTLRDEIPEAAVQAGVAPYIRARRREIVVEVAAIEE